MMEDRLGNILVGDTDFATLINITDTTGVYRFLNSPLDMLLIAAKKALPVDGALFLRV